MSSGASVTEQELPENSAAEKYEGAPSGLSVFFQKKLLTNSIDILFSLLIKAKNSELSKAVYSYLSLAVYRCYRMIYSAGKDNDEHVFSVPEDKVSALTTAALSIEDLKARDAAANEGSEDEKITTARIEQEYTKQAAALLSVVNTSEKTLNKFQQN